MKNLQRERKREREGKSLTTTPHARPVGIAIVLIKRVVSPITTPSVEVIKAIKPSCKKQSNWDHVEVFAFIRCKK